MRLSTSHSARKRYQRRTCKISPLHSSSIRETRIWFTMRYRSSFSTAILAAAFLWNDVFVVDAQQEVYGNCDSSTYYDSLIGQLGFSPTSWTFGAVQDLITSTHRNQLDADQDAYDAVIDLWPGEDDGSGEEAVHLAYRDVSFPARPYGTAETWSRANIWPESRRAGFPAESERDVHANVAVQTAVLASKGDLMFGECGVVENAFLCRTVPDAPETSTDDKIWFVPEDARGPQARMALYLAARYGNATSLSDCPPFGDSQFGYLSALLQWHADYPVTDEERERNTRACGAWQGNRNPFVDYPELASQFFGEPDSIRTGTQAYESCFDPFGTITTSSPTAADTVDDSPAASPDGDGSNSTLDDSATPAPSTELVSEETMTTLGPTPAFDDANNETDSSNTTSMTPTFSPTYSPNACQNVLPGAVQIILVNSEAPDQLGFFALDNIPQAVDALYVTDRPWDGQQLLDNGEGTIMVRDSDCFLCRNSGPMRLCLTPTPASILSSSRNKYEKRSASRSQLSGNRTASGAMAYAHHISSRTDSM